MHGEIVLYTRPLCVMLTLLMLIHKCLLYLPSFRRNVADFTSIAVQCMHFRGRHNDAYSSSLESTELFLKSASLKRFMQRFSTWRLVSARPASLHAWVCWQLATSYRSGSIIVFYGSRIIDSHVHYSDQRAVFRTPITWSVVSTVIIRIYEN